MNPFAYGSPLPPEDLIDREQEAHRLLRMAEAGQNMRLVAPRRYGKTTLLRRLLRDCEQAGMNTVYVDFFGVVSFEEVALRIEEAYRSLRGPFANAVLAALRALRPSVGVRAVGVSAQLSAAEEHAQRRLLRLLDLPVRAFERSGARTLVVFDEFQDVLGADSNADGVIRSRIQHHREEAAYVFAGSLPGMMRTLFESRGRAFFGQTSALTLGPLPEAELADFLQRRFEATGKQLGELLDPLLDLAAGHPHAAMMLAHHLWEHMPAGGRADIDGWEAARAAVFAEVHDRYVATWEGLRDSERKLLSALASEPQPFAREALVRRGLKPATARKARGRLLADGELVRDERGWRLADPLFAAWVAEARRGDPIS
jgi:hypothetical protein